MTDKPRGGIEVALAQSKDGGGLLSVDLFERRQRLMDDWAEQLARKGL